MPSSVYRHFLQFLCGCTCTKKQRTIFHLRMYKKQPSQSITLPDCYGKGFVTEKDMLRKRLLCTTAPTFSLTWQQTLHPCCIIVAFPVQYWPVLGYTSNGPVLLPASSSKQRCCQGIGTPAHHAPSEAEDRLQVFSGHIFSPSPLW